MGLGAFTTGGELLWFSSLRGVHLAGMGFDFIVTAPLLPSGRSFSFVFGYF